MFWIVLVCCPPLALFLWLFGFFDEDDE